MLRSFPNNRKRNDRQQKHMALLRYRCTVSEYTIERTAAPNRMFREESLVGVMSRFGLLDYELRVQGLVSRAPARGPFIKIGHEAARPACQ